MTDTMRRRWPELLALSAALIWGINVPFIKLALASVPMFTLNAIRFTFSLMIMGFFHYQHVRKNGATEMNRGDYIYVIVLGLFGNLVYQALFIFGLTQTTAGNVALLMSSTPLWAALISQFFKIDRLVGGIWLGLLISLGGTIFVVLNGGKTLDFSDETLPGNLLIIGAAMAWATYTVFAKPKLQKVPAVTLTFYGLLFSIPALWGMAFIDAGDVDWFAVPVSAWAIIALSGTLSTGLALILWQSANHIMGPARTAAYNNLPPIITIVVGFLLLDEPILIRQLAGGAFILGGLYVMRKSATKSKPVVLKSLSSDDTESAEDNINLKKVG